MVLFQRYDRYSRAVQSRCLAVHVLRTRMTCGLLPRGVGPGDKSLAHPAAAYLNRDLLS